MRHQLKLWALAAACALTWAGQARAINVPKPATEEEVKARIAKTGDAKDYPGSDRVIVLDESDCTVGDNGVATTIQRRVVKILEASGIRAETAQQFDFDPDTTRNKVLAVRIHRKNGEVEEVPLDSIVQRPSPAHWIYWGNQVKLLTLPRLRIGDTVDITTSKRGFNIAYLSGGETGTAEGGELIPPMPGHWYETVYFADNLPIIEKRYTVRLPADKPMQYEVYHGTVRCALHFDGDYHAYSFFAENVPPVKSEPHRIAFSDVACKLVMATLEDWEGKSRWFYDANETQFGADENIESLVAELTRGLTTDEEKISALVHWSADEIRYVGTSRGPCEGYTLHPGIETFRDRGGVCKDKAGMLITMLRAAGYESYPVLTQAGSDVEIIPADQFNHTVTCVRNKDGSLTLLDPTWVPLSREWWSTREPRQAVVYGLPEGKTLLKSPYYPPEDNLFHASAESRIDAGGTLFTNIRWHDMVGYPDTYARRTIDRFPLRDLRGYFEEEVGRIALNTRLSKVNHTDPYDYTQSAEVEVSAVAESFALGGDRTRLFRLPLMQHPLAGIFVPDFFYELPEKREYGMRIRASRLAKYEETIRIPPGWRVQHVPENVNIDEEAASILFEADSAPDYVRYRFELAIREQIIPAEQYAGYKKVMEAMNEIAEDWVICEVGGAAAKVAFDHEIEKEAGHAMQ